MDTNELSHEKELTAQQKKKGRSEILLAFIEHGSRPAALVLIGLFVTIWLFSVKDVLKTVRVASFELELQTITESAKLSNELEALAELTDEQMQLFLIVGKKRTHITYKGKEVTDENLSKLYEKGLLSEWRKEPSGDYWWRVSENGHRLHDIIFNLIFSSIRRSATQ